MTLGRVKELEVLIRRHQDHYYKGQATISDAEFDNLWDELKNLDPNNELFRKVGDDSLDGFPKVQHVIPMGSQQKANSAFRNFPNSNLTTARLVCRRLLRLSAMLFPALLVPRKPSNGYQMTSVARWFS